MKKRPTSNAESTEKALALLAKYADSGVPSSGAEPALRSLLKKLRGAENEQARNYIGGFLMFWVKRLETPMKLMDWDRVDEIRKAESSYREKFREFLTRSDWKIEKIREIEHIDLVPKIRRMIVRDWILGPDWPTVAGLLHLRELKRMLPASSSQQPKRPAKQPRPIKPGTIKDAIMKLGNGKVPAKLSNRDEQKIADALNVLPASVHHKFSTMMKSIPTASGKSTK